MTFGVRPFDRWRWRRQSSLGNINGPYFSSQHLSSILLSCNLHWNRTSQIWLMTCFDATFRLLSDHHGKQLGSRIVNWVNWSSVNHSCVGISSIKKTPPHMLPMLSKLRLWFSKMGSSYRFRKMQYIVWIHAFRKQALWLSFIQLAVMPKTHPAFWLYDN